MPDELEAGVVTDFKGRMTYGGYLQLGRLLSAQLPLSACCCRDAPTIRTTPVIPDTDLITVTPDTAAVTPVMAAVMRDTAAATAPIRPHWSASEGSAPMADLVEVAIMVADTAAIPTISIVTIMAAAPKS